MKKNSTLVLLGVLIILILCILGLTIYEDYFVDDNNDAKIYPMISLDIKIPNYTLINSKINNSYIYNLYSNNNDYLIKEININTRKEQLYSKKINSKCSLQNESSEVYIVCKNNNEIVAYNKKFETIIKRGINNLYEYILNKDNKYSVYDSNNIDYPIVKSAKCLYDCLYIRYNDLKDITSIYKNNELLEENIKYQEYVNGYITYKDNKIKIYTNETYKEFRSPINNLTSKVMTLSSNNYYLYVYDNNIIRVFNLYDGSNFSNIDIYKIDKKINNMYIYNNNLYIYTIDKIYILDISEIEENNIYNSLEYENKLINNKISYIENNYSLKVNIKDNPNYLNNNYKINAVTNYNDIIDALSYIEDYLLYYNKYFFQRFYEYGMDGLEIYFANDIKGLHNGFYDTDVVGVSFKKNNKYIIIVELYGKENVLNILNHETMHIIDNYLGLKGFNYNWNNYNKDDFNYSNVYYVNEIFKDTLNNNKNPNEIYFIDNYARSSEVEDRARIYEYICKKESFIGYPHLNAKVNYLKSVLASNFPELIF